MLDCYKILAAQASERGSEQRREWQGEVRVRARLQRPNSLQCMLAADAHIAQYCCVLQAQSVPVCARCARALLL